MSRARRILILRRENIGDLVCTTPLITTLRNRFPEASIVVFANAYNAAVLEGNRTIDRVVTYTKGKHAAGGVDRLRNYWAFARTCVALRREGFDDIVIAEPMYSPRNVRLARFLKGTRAGTRVIGFESDDGIRTGLDIALPQDHAHTLAMPQLIHRLSAAWEIHTPPEAVPPVSVARVSARGAKTSRVIGVHISARKPSQRWTAARYAELVHKLNQQMVANAAPAAEFRLFWSPGEEGNPLHPGDDAKASEVLDLCRGLPIVPVPTQSLSQLIAGLGESDVLFCSDGGAMHVAAGLGIPIVALFGDSDAVRWRPWGVTHRVLQAATREAMDIEVGEAVGALAQLVATLNHDQESAITTSPSSTSPVR